MSTPSTQCPPSPRAEASVAEESLATARPGSPRRSDAPREPVDLSMVAERAIATTQHLAQNRNIALECHGPALSLDADGQAIQRVLEDLISTALRRNPRDGWVSVDMTALPNGARFTVTDRGEGLPPREVLRTMGPTQSTARALGDGLTVRDGQGEGNGVSFTVLDRSGAAPRVH